MPYWRERFVTVGVLADGRWYVEATGSQVQPFPDEAAARAAVAELTGDGWAETPANLGPDGRPTEGGWVQRGGYWVRH